MAESRSILELKRKALSMGLCGDYKGRWDNATTPKELIDMALDINGADFLCASVAKGWGVSKDFFLHNFSGFINGKYVSRQKKGYTSELYVGHNGVINARTTLLIVLYSDAVIHIPQNTACRVFSAGNTSIRFTDDWNGYVEYVEYAPLYKAEEGNHGCVRIVNPRSDKSSWLNFSGAE